MRAASMPGRIEALTGDAAIRAGGVWTLTPGRPFIEDALILCSGGKVAEVGARREVDVRRRAEIQDLGDAVLAPGLVNAHIHLCLSHAADMRPAFGQGFSVWLRSILPLLREPPTKAQAASAVGQLLASGAAHAGDIVSHHPNVALDAFAAARGRGLTATHFLEAFGFLPSDAAEPAWSPELAAFAEMEQGANIAAAGHALYSTRPERLVAAKAWSARRGLPFSLHLAEVPGEEEMLLTGGGELAEFFHSAGILPRGYRPPARRPVAEAAYLGLLDERTLAVHCVHADAEDCRILVDSGAGVCLCPRSNELIGVGRAPWEKLRRAGAKLCLGTDGLTSNEDLDLWSELRYFKQNFKDELAGAEALSMVSATPSDVLGLSPELGRIAPGARAVFSVVPLDLARPERWSAPS